MIFSMAIDPKIAENLPHLSQELLEEISTEGIIKDIDGETEILREGQYVKVIPIVLDGLIKVFSSHEDKELLLYYIRPGESCIMSFASSLRNEPSCVFAITEENTRALLLPVDKVSAWSKQFSDINTLFFQQYNLRYGELLETINHVLFDKMDKRVYDYLRAKVELTGKNPIKLSHRVIANELGTAREVVTRVIKKLESEGFVSQESGYITISPR